MPTSEEKNQAYKVPARFMVPHCPRKLICGDLDLGLETSQHDATPGMISWINASSGETPPTWIEMSCASIRSQLPCGETLATDCPDGRFLGHKSAMGSSPFWSSTWAVAFCFAPRC